MEAAPPAVLLCPDNLFMREVSLLIVIGRALTLTADLAVRKYCHAKIAPLHRIHGGMADVTYIPEQAINPRRTGKSGVTEQESPR